MRLFSPRKTTLLLVVRDKTKVSTVPQSEIHKFRYLFCSLVLSAGLTFLYALFCLSLQTPLEYLTQALREDLQKVPRFHYLVTCFPLFHLPVVIIIC
jgi:hypothetical protein